jgi:hypothetical protein
MFHISYVTYFCVSALLALFFYNGNYKQDKNAYVFSIAEGKSHSDMAAEATLLLWMSAYVLYHF